MKEKYLRPAVVNADTMELSITKTERGVLPILEAITAAATAGYVLGKSLKKVFGITNSIEKLSSLTERKTFDIN